jgi:membrane-anchored glycerophosphoryl diester phosphodiesterase (GDPDase)
VGKLKESAKQNKRHVLFYENIIVIIIIIIVIIIIIIVIIIIIPMHSGNEIVEAATRTTNNLLTTYIARKLSGVLSLTRLLPNCAHHTPYISCRNHQLRTHQRHRNISAGTAEAQTVHTYINHE